MRISNNQVLARDCALMPIVTMPTSISQNSSSGRGVGKAKERERAVQ